MGGGTRSPHHPTKQPWEPAYGKACCSGRTGKAVVSSRLAGNGSEGVNCHHLLL